MESGSLGGDAPYRSGGYEHDDRAGSGGGRGSGIRGGRGRGRRGGRWIRSRGGRGHREKGDSSRSQFQDEDGDFSMDDRNGKNIRFRPYTSRSSSSGGGEGSTGRSVFNRLGGPAEGAFARLSGLGGDRRGESWHKVTVPKGGTQSTEWLIKQLKSNISEPFQAIQIHQLGEKLMFFVNDIRAANQLKKLGQVQSRNGPLTVLVKPCPPPKGSGQTDKRDGGSRFVSASRYRGRGLGNRDDDEVMEEDPTEIVKMVLGQRFDTSTRSLDLSDMYHEPVFREHGIKASMYNREFVTCVLSLIAQYCPELQALDLSSNGLQRLEVYSDLPAKCSSLQILNLSDNLLHNPADLQSINGMNSLTTLVLENNPLSQLIDQDVVGFAGSLRKLFPNLQTLDGQQLPSPVKFDVPVTSGQLPLVTKSYIVNDDVKQLVVTFIEQYYVMFDSDTRDKLLEAYANEAVLSVSVCSSRGVRFDSYIKDSRNMTVLKDSAKRRSFLKQGRIDVVHFLRGLPRTVHHSKTFSVDVMRATPMGTAFVVYGVFSEVDEAKAVRAFTRIFVLTAAGNGVAIVNDQWTIRSSSESSRQLFQDVSSTHTTTAGPSGSQAPSSQSSLSLSIGTSQSHVHNTQDDAVINFSQQTKMNLEWSKRCLSDNNWDIDKATAVFSVMQSQGSIPAEAFQ